MPIRQPRALELARAVFGVTELLLPDLVAEHILGHQADARERNFIRILGSRHLLQSLLLLRSRSDAAHRLGAGVDAIHTVTMIVIAVRDPRRKVAATVNATIATVSAALTRP